jgi:hypothetical protein
VPPLIYSITLECEDLYLAIRSPPLDLVLSQFSTTHYFLQIHLHIIQQQNFVAYFSHPFNHLFVTALMMSEDVYKWWNPFLHSFLYLLLSSCHLGSDISHSTLLSQNLHNMQGKNVYRMSVYLAISTFHLKNHWIDFFKFYMNIMPLEATANVCFLALSSLTKKYVYEITILCLCSPFFSLWINWQVLRKVYVNLCY